MLMVVVERGSGRGEVRVPVEIVGPMEVVPLFPLPSFFRPISLSRQERRATHLQAVLV